MGIEPTTSCPSNRRPFRAANFTAGHKLQLSFYFLYSLWQFSDAAPFSSGEHWFSLKFVTTEGSPMKCVLWENTRMCAGGHIMILWDWMCPAGKCSPGSLNVSSEKIPTFELVSSNHNLSQKGECVLREITISLFSWRTHFKGVPPGEFQGQRDGQRSSHVQWN